MCAYLRLDSIKENIEGDANLHHPPPVIGLKKRIKQDYQEPIENYVIPILVIFSPPRLNLMKRNVSDSSVFLFYVPNHRLLKVSKFLSPAYLITKSYIIKFSLSVCLSMCVSMLVQNRLSNHACYGDEAFAGDSVGLGLGQRLNFILKKLF